MSEILTSIAQPMRYMIELDTPLVLKKNSGMLMEGDVEANTVVMEVFKTRNVPADLRGITFSLYFTRPDGNTLKPIEGTVEENTVRLTLTGGCYKYTGQYTMLVTMKKGVENRTVLKATGHMEGRNTENMIDPEGTFPTPEELLEMLNMLDEALQSANTATENATAAATRANNAAAGIETVTATATELEPNEEATAQVIKGESGMHFAFGIPRGEKGEKGEKGDPGTAENVTIDSVAGLREALNNKQPKGDYLPADGTAADANKLGGKLPEAYATKESLEQYATKEDLENIDVGQLKEEVSQLKADIGDAWTSGKTYAVGDYCISGNRLYKCKTAHTSGSAFNSDYWEVVNVSNEVKSALIGIAQLNGVRIYEYGIEGSHNNIDNTASIDLSALEAGVYMVLLVGGHTDGANFSYTYIGYCNVSGSGYYGFSLSEITRATEYTITWIKEHGKNNSILTIKAYADEDWLFASGRLIFIGK